MNIIRESHIKYSCYCTSCGEHVLDEIKMIDWATQHVRSTGHSVQRVITHAVIYSAEAES